MEDRGGVAIIPARRSRKGRKSVDGHIHALRNRIKRCFNRLKNADLLPGNFRDLRLVCSSNEETDDEAIEVQRGDGVFGLPWWRFGALLAACR